MEVSKPRCFNFSSEQSVMLYMYFQSALHTLFLDCFFRLRLVKTAPTFPVADDSETVDLR